MTEISFSLEPRPPFRLDLTVWALRRRPHNLVDRWDGRAYRRVLVLKDQPVKVAVTQTGSPAVPHLQVQARGIKGSPEKVAALTAVLTRMLGLHADLENFYLLAENDPQLRPLVREFLGLKPPRFPTLFEALVNAIACQQLSLTVGIHLLNRLATARGLAFPGESAAAPAFPRPQDLAGAAPEELRSLGFSRQKERFLVELARRIIEEKLNLEALADLDDAAALQHLRAFRGVGRWTAEYALLRGLGRWHLFPGDDVGARHRLREWLHLPEPLDYEGVYRVLARWRPFGGLLYFHFLLGSLAAEGRLS